MRSPNLTRALAELAATNCVHHIDTATGRRYSVTTEEHAALMPVLPARVRVRMTEVDAAAEQARVLAEIQGRN
jgi:hypothetical protein